MAGSCISTVLSGTVILAIALLCSACSTTWTPIQIAVFNPAQLFPESTDVRGLRGSTLYGKNASLYGLDVGLMNEVEERVRGVQLASVANRAGELDGLGVGLANEVEERVRGVQLAGFVNFAGELAGVQLAGILNRSERVVGVQIGGLVNRAEALAGLQIGLLNFNKSGPLPFFPIFNFGFSGESEEVDESEASED
jgi:hypothetical protein